MKRKSLIKKFAFLALVTGCGLTACHKGIVPEPPPQDSLSGWTHLPAPMDTINVLEVFGNTIYAGSNSNALYTSTDGGQNWTSSKVGPSDGMITAIRVFNNNIYVGTVFNGIFSSHDGGRTWTSAGSSLAQNPITSFAERKNTLYAAAGEDGGVFVLDEIHNTWAHFNNNLPESITSYWVFKLLNSSDTLVAAAGVNGTFYHYDFAAARWVETYLPKWGFYISEMIVDGGSLYAITTEHKIIRSYNNGISWLYDSQDANLTSPIFFGLHHIYAGTGKDYLTANSWRDGVWIQQRDRSAAAGSSWSNGQEFLKAVFVNTILETGGKLFLGTNTGLYFKKTT